ncbi:hypothetical protein FWP33_08835 [Vibrio parahaemolyticus]|uniref:Uncharacterized protein n=2 Tax=Vibrio harveyi group TaxID=717610 RepID=A0A9Q3U9I5_VIBPH|nr:hypothetical protein [Vibrio parahaemolyticus]ELA8176696.1 hypothetical protein [Vibrio alginolyticus]CAH1598780.1 exported hypothetical protein [Vibrio jasicida]EGQ9742623.1 hypothetical protein [Vibrio parahaemolyticus]EJC7176135.1 hypothetical protein [Vibrio parahaemolyticus]EJE4724574.1 hypothetical protein [Vibrio parahaemolyticus]
MIFKALSTIALVSCSLFTSSNASASNQTNISIQDYTKSSFVIEGLPSNGHLAKLAYKLSDSDSITSGIEKAQAVSQELIGNSTTYGYSEISSYVTTNVQNGDEIYIVVETAFIPKSKTDVSSNSMLYSQVVLSNKQHQLALVNSVMDNSFTF